MVKSMNAALDVTSLLDPEIAAVLGALPIDVGALLGSLSNETIVDVRVTMSMMPMPELSDRVERTDHVIDSSTGVVVRVHRPIGVDGDLPCVYWTHASIGGAHCSAASVCRSATDWHPRPRIPARSTTVIRGCVGCTTTQAQLASTGRGSV